MITFIIKSSLSLLLLYGLYWFLLRNEKLFVFNRYFLNFSIVFSLVIPFVNIPLNVQESESFSKALTVLDYNFASIDYGHKGVIQEANSNASLEEIRSSAINVSTVLMIIYISGLIFFLIRFLRNIYIISKKIFVSERIRFKEYMIILTNDNQGPHCFLNYIFLNREDYLNGRIDSELINHELEHIRQSHSIDIIIIEIIKIFYWFNPIFLFYDKAIRINHEYLADHSVIIDSLSIRSYTEKLFSFIQSSNIPLTSGSSNSFTKRRLLMMTKSNSRLFMNRIRIVSTLFMVVMVLLILGFKVADKQPSEFNPSITTIVAVQNMVRGIVMTEDGMPLFAATITATDTNIPSSKVSTDYNGQFNLADIKTGSPLLIEYRGFKSQYLKADLESEMIVKMVRDTDYKGRIIIPEIKVASFRNSDFTPAKALLVINGKIIDSKGELKLNRREIKSFKILKDDEAANKYGDKGKDGVVEIISFGNENESVGRKLTASDTSEYNTLISVNKGTNKEELINIPVSNIQYVSVWTYHDFDKIVKKDLRTIAIMTRDYYKVKGKVVGENGNPLAAVKISVSGEPERARSDREGSFLIDDVRENALLEFSLQGFKPYYINTSFVPFNTELTVELKEDGIPDKEEVYETAEKMPQYPGGDMELLKFIGSNTVYPEVAKSDNAQGKVIVRFIINTKGNVENAVVLKGVHPALDAEALRVVNMLKGFAPGSQGGKPINVYYNLPITYSLPISR